MVCCHPRTTTLPTGLELEVAAEAVRLTLRFVEHVLKKYQALGTQLPETLHKALAPLSHYLCGIFIVNPSSCRQLLKLLPQAQNAHGPSWAACSCGGSLKLSPTSCSSLQVPQLLPEAQGARPPGPPFHVSLF